MSRIPEHDPREHLLRQLRRQLGRRPADTPTAMSTDGTLLFSAGAPAIDRLLPGGGLRYGMLIEWLAEFPGSGAATLSLLAAREACRAGGMFVVLDRQRTFYPPAAVAWGIDPQRLVVVHPRSLRDELWAAVQALRSPAVAAMWAAIDRLDDRAFRRLQLAARAGQTLGLLLRPACARSQPSWADVQLSVGAGDWGLGTRGWGMGAVASRKPSVNSLTSDCQLQICNPQTPSPQPPVPPLALDSRPSTLDSSRRVRVSVLRCRGGRAGNSALLEIDDAAHTLQEVTVHHAPHSLPLVAELADPAARSISARA